MIGYALGISIIIIGIIFIVISCIDNSWKKEQVNKMRQEGAAQGWQAPRTDNLDKEAQFSSNGYSATLSSSLQQPPPLQSQSFWGSQDSNRQAVSSMAQQPETQRLFMAAGSTAGNAMLQGASQEDIFYATATNPQVQIAAFETAKKAVTNPDVRAAALKGAENALSRAYDNIFDGE
ncbi:MAG: hypothetical protein EZS28_039616 [Streblomastix strix]|uniref:Uncharacterized protein n=1 Tax=Streblomastix strix TaxID=222440 RepID=A0A5J4U3I8_9EUKA|nr:MAG: hypothetical protein EZS28_039616 [Streblomastix strix]